MQRAAKRVMPQLRKESEQEFKAFAKRCRHTSACEPDDHQALLEFTKGLKVLSYKPDPRAYQLAVDCLNVTPRQINLQSANGWNAARAASFGLRVVWINRSGQPRERLPAEPDAELALLSELPGLLGL